MGLTDRFVLPIYCASGRLTRVQTHKGPVRAPYVHGKNDANSRDDSVRAMLNFSGGNQRYRGHHQPPSSRGVSLQVVEHNDGDRFELLAYFSLLPYRYLPCGFLPMMSLADTGP